jgi:hypothetical protein
MFYVLLMLVPILLHFIGFRFLIFKFRNTKPPMTRVLLFLSQLPLYLLILLTIIGYSKLVLYSVLAGYTIFNLTLQLLAHRSTKKFKHNFIEQCKIKFQQSVVKD